MATSPAPTTPDYGAMDLEAFRQVFRAWLEDNLPSEWRTREFPMNWPPGDDDPHEEEISRQWHRQLYEGGWIAPGWPKEHGGLDLGLAHRMIMEEELAQVRAPVAIGFSGLEVVGSALIMAGTPEQQQQFLPSILSGDILFCQGYSEPDAGSDLASLRTKAVRDGDDYVVTGQKVWTSYGHRADWCFMLVRTGGPDSKHKGISFLLADMDTPGIEWRRLHMITGEGHFGELILDEARVPVANRIGPEHEGWRIATHSLVYERMMSGNGPGPIRARLDSLMRLVRATGSTPLIRQDIARLEARVRAVAGLQATALRAATAGDPRVGALAALVKLAASETRIAITQVAGQVVGMASVAAGPDYKDPAASFQGGTAALWAWETLDALSGPIYAGTSEVLRNIIAENGLGLPR